MKDDELDYKDIEGVNGGRGEGPVLDATKTGFKAEAGNEDISKNPACRPVEREGDKLNGTGREIKNYI